MPANLGQFVRPSTVAIFKGDPISKGRAIGFILGGSFVPLPGQFIAHTLPSVTIHNAFDVTRNPVERAVASNIQPLPQRVTVDCTVSATPLGSFLTAVQSLLGAGAEIFRLDLRALKELRKLAYSREPVVLITPARLFNNMAITDIIEDHTGELKVDISITLEEMRIASPVLVPDTFDALTVGTYDIDNLGRSGPKRFP